MKTLFLTGGPLFMSILTILFICMVAWIIYHWVRAYRSPQPDTEKILGKLKTGRSIGLFALVTGILGQLIGLYEAFSFIEKAGDISPVLIFGGIKVSMVSTLYGIVIYLVSLILWFVAAFLVEKRSESVTPE